VGRDDGDEAYEFGCGLTRWTTRWRDGTVVMPRPETAGCCRSRVLHVAMCERRGRSTCRFCSRREVRRGRQGTTMDSGRASGDIG
jgi:hypothetical protein